MQRVVVAPGKGKTEKKKEAGRNKKGKRRRKNKERRNKREGRKKNKEERARPKLIHFHLPIARPRRPLFIILLILGGKKVGKKRKVE